MEREQMEGVGSSPTPEDDYLVDFDFDDGWLGLTLHEGTRAEARKMAADLVGQFNPLRLGSGGASLQQELERRALAGFESGSVLTTAAYTEGGVLLADFSVFVHGEDDVQRPSPEEYLPELLKWPYAEVKGEPRISDVQLPIGRAVRVQTVLAAKRRFGWGKKLSESLLYGVWPDGQEEIVVVEARWLNFERADELTDLVDRLMPSMRLLPVPDSCGEG
ncbi:hypothetical protein [Streptomyces formicae]|uniref:Uncharacterized protein n=1 Tax=Streptomyces formicae TaxID=1616117 RepID=A0A291QDX9_9ACTN|nr:hypothetical protein [Streptomyces formicae]ATL29663.1 hypothetical protein KY5_4645c [Streptomyces formicae]